MIKVVSNSECYGGCKLNKKCSLQPDFVYNVCWILRFFLLKEDRDLQVEL